MGKKITSNMRVCSLHFSETDYFSTAIKLCEDNDQLCNSENGEKNVDEFNDLSISLDQVPIATVSQKNKDTEPTKILKVDVGISVKSGDLVEHNFSNFIKTDKELSTATGIPSFKILNLLCKIVEKVAPILRSYTGKLTIQDRVILTFTKLKQNVSYAFLALLFPSCSERHIPNVICNILDILGNALKDAIIFPSKQEILKNIPSCFREYANVCLILDCTEIEIQRPQNLCDQLLTYSFYKGRHTVKFLTGCSPGGLLTYVSPAYGGRASDKAIFEQSNIIQTIGTGSSIMVDKGFNIDDICFENGIRIVRPPFLRNKAQFSETEALDTRGIASARVHVERLNQRMKVFQILGSKMPSCLVKKSEHIMTIIAAVINLSAPILKDDKFQK
ncbi:uncharacterized protein LOC122505180 [Leptopilina heterotoma]|uniref:uncharacterized protein LOC122505180 n=1 Tax=Leptopilina heterotoma TaxID=63436 RepID=UPI001CA95D8D|nr:uncharacterized protein LOC122505180 [Leptopilina heterotoma]